MLFTVTNEINFALIAIDIAPSTLIACTTIGAAYFYLIHTRDNPLPSPATDKDGHDRRNRGSVRRPSFFRRLSARLRTRKQRARPVAALWPLRITSLWLPVRRLGLGEGRVGFWRRLQPASMAAHKERHAQQWLLEEQR